MGVRTAMRVRLAAAAALLGMACLLAGCTDTSDDSPGADPSTTPTGTQGSSGLAAQFPSGDWERTSPRAAGFVPARLRRVVGEARRSDSSCFAVVRDGRLVAERYWGDGSPTTGQAAFSVTKSITSTLVGLAQADGSLDLDEPASRYIREWRRTPSATVTIRNLLSNDSGREWSFQSDYGDLIHAEHRTAYAIGLGQDAPPGTVWTYNNAAIQTLDRVLSQATGEATGDFAQTRLLSPLGMTHSVMTGDAGGHSTGTYSGLQTTCMDLARFGLLFAQDGRWGDHQLVPRSWVRAATGAPSQPLNAAYGLLWWLNRYGELRGPLNQSDTNAAPDVYRVGRVVPDGPPDMFAALGLGGQVVLVDPGSQTVVVRMGPVTLGQDDSYSFADAARVITYAAR